MNKIVKGALSGFAATLPMTVTMWALRRYLHDERGRTLPPRQITMGLAKDAGIPTDKIPSPAKTALTTLAHFGYGSLAGSVFAALCGKKCPRILNGGTFGLAIWALSYAGWLPAARLQPTPGRQTLSRNVMMVTSHLVWGAALAAGLRKFWRPTRGFARS